MDDRGVAVTAALRRSALALALLAAALSGCVFGTDFPPDCRPCDGVGRLDCPACDPGANGCSTCKDHGTLRCEACRGTGRDEAVD